MIVKNLVFISGWGTNYKIWGPIADKMDRNITFIPWWSCLTTDSCDNYLLRKISELNGSTVLVGWSLGGMIALSAVAEKYDNISDLVLISSSSRMLIDTNYQGVNKRLIRGMKLGLKADKQRLIKDFANMAILPEKDELLKSKFISQAMTLDDYKLTDGLTYLQNCDLREKLPYIKVPVSIIHGELDGIMNLDNARYLDSHLPNSRLEVIIGAGHFLPHLHSEIIIESIKKLI